MEKYSLILNAGSATLKFKLFSLDNQRQVMAGNFERIGLANPILGLGREKWRFKKITDHRSALQIILQKLGEKRNNIELIGHRIVHGGRRFIRPVLITKNVWRQIAKYDELAPLHNPVNLAVVWACYSLLPGMKNVGVFDTAFFSGLREENYLYALPYELSRRYDIRRYGFHGISHEYMTQTAAGQLHKPLKRMNLITVHLGNGCSISAIQKGRPLTTSMGFTPTEGLVMGTRCGNIDPIIPLYLRKKIKLSHRQIDELLNNKSGLLGLSGFSSDMREILKAAGRPVINYQGRKTFSALQRKRARLALKIFINRLRQYLIIYAGLLGRVEAIVFTGGIGERSPLIRKLAIKGLRFGKHPKILVVPANEERAIFQQIKNKV